MKKLAQQLYFWPGMNNSIIQYIQACTPCQSHLPAQVPPPQSLTLAKFPMDHVSADLFSLQGKNYLVASDRYSGMIWCDRLNSTTTDAVSSKLDYWFTDFGYPIHIRTDGGPQFRQLFDSWCSSKGIIHQLSSPYHPESNGHAENAVKNSKFLLEKCDANLRHFRTHLLAWRTTPRADGTSPSSLFFGHHLRRANPLPCISPSGPSAHILTPASSIIASRHAKAAKSASSLPNSSLSPLSPGTLVSVYDKDSARWAAGQPATIISPRRPDNRSYVLEKEDGSTTVRTRSHLWTVPPPYPD